jgi:hypothetical protein
MTFCAGLNCQFGGKIVFRRLFLSASVLALTGGLALAQAQGLSQTSPMQGPSVGYRRPRRVRTSTARLIISDIYKANVYDNAEKKIGDITDLVINRDGRHHDGRDWRRRVPWRWPEGHCGPLQGAEYHVA